MVFGWVLGTVYPKSRRLATFIMRSQKDLETELTLPRGPSVPSPTGPSASHLARLKMKMVLSNLPIHDEYAKQKRGLGSSRHYCGAGILQKGLIISF